MLLLLPLAWAGPNIEEMATRLAPEVAAIRGLALNEPIDMNVLSVAALKARLTEEEITPPEYERMLKNLGLVGRDADLDAISMALLEDQIGGFYDPEARELVLVDRELGDDSFLNQILLVHELCHAIDDQVVPLAKMLDTPTFDQQLVARSVIEGSASATMLAWVLQGVARGTVKLSDLLAGMSGASQMGSESLYQAPSIVASSLIFPYMAGTAFLMSGHAQEDLMQASWLGERFIHAAQNPPASMEQVLHPEKYDYEVDVPEVITGFPDGIYQDTLGELGCMALLDPKNKLIKKASFTNIPLIPACEGWDGDRYVELEGGGAIWATVWDTEKDRDEFVKAWGKRRLDGESWGDRGQVFWVGDRPKDLVLPQL